MKPFQLLAGCLLALVCAGTAQAAEMGGGGLHCRELVMGGGVGGVLAAIGTVLSSEADTEQAQSSDHAACPADDNDAAACTSVPGADSRAVPSAGHRGSDDSTAPTTRKRQSPSLGWQSLLPGSIQ